MKNGYNEEKVSQVDNSKMIGGNNLLKMYVQERDYAVERKTAVFTSENLHDINFKLTQESNFDHQVKDIFHCEIYKEEIIHELKE